MEKNNEVNVEGVTTSWNGLNKVPEQNTYEHDQENEEDDEEDNEEQIDEQAEIEQLEKLARLKEILFGLPTNIILKLIQNKCDIQNYKIKKECINMLSKCLSIFILYITDCALEHAEHDKKGTIFKEHILSALDESLFLDIATELKREISQDEEMKTTQNKDETNKGHNKNTKTTDSKFNARNEKNQKPEGDKPPNAEGRDDFDILLDALE